MQLLQPDYILKKRSIGYTHLFNGLSFDVNNSSDLRRVINTFNSFSVIGIKDLISGSIPSFVDSGLFGLGYFSYDNQIWIDWILLYPITERLDSLTKEYSHKTLSVIFGYLFRQSSILYVSCITKSFEIIEIDEFLDNNSIDINHYIRRVKHIIGSFYNPILLKEIKR